jgi:hypothetical protein
LNIARINLVGEGRACNALMAFKKVQAMATVTRALVMEGIFSNMFQG